MHVVSVEELVRAMTDYSAGMIGQDEARVLAERALEEAESAMDIWLFDRVRTLAKRHPADSGEATQPGGIHDATKKIG